LPINEEFSQWGWINDRDRMLPGGSRVWNLYSYYAIPVSYTLTDEDVVVINGVIQSCSCDVSRKITVIPDTLDGQAVTGIGISVFEAKGLVGLSLPSSIQVIGKESFSSNDLKHIDFSKCRSLAAIGSGAFCSNDLAGVDLSACRALSSIDSMAFDNNRLKTLELPVPDLPGLLFVHWMDEDGRVYHGGETVDDLQNSYTAKLLTAYSVIVKVSAENLPVEEAVVTLTGYETLITDSAGLVVFAKVLPEEYIVFQIRKLGFDTFTDSVSVVDSDVSKDIELSPLTHTVTFNITDGTKPIIGAEVRLPGYETVFSDSAGIVVFPGLRKYGVFVFKFSAPGFEDYSLQLRSLLEDIHVDIILREATGILNARVEPLRIFPNPTEGVIIIETDFVGQVAVEITTLHGQLIQSEQVITPIHKVDISSYQKGVYFVTIRSKDFVTSKTIIKQ
jgi:hypothetical protein